MEEFVPVACSCGLARGSEELILQYIRRAKKESEDVKQIKEQRIKMIKEDKTLSRYKKVLMLNALQDEMKEEIQKRNETILNNLLSGKDNSIYNKVCCKIFMNERATLGIDGERYDSLDYYYVD